MPNIVFGAYLFRCFSKNRAAFKAEKHRFPPKLLRSFRKNVRHYYSSRFVNRAIFRLKRQFLA